MAELITVQRWIDAGTDTDTLEAAVNEDKWVTSRLGKEYASIPMASRLLVENGLLGATPFSTYAAMMSSTLAENAYAIVTNDIDKANGVYKKEGGYFVRQSYSPASDLGQLIKVVSQKYAANLVEFADDSGKIYMLVDGDGKLQLTGLDSDVQTLLTNAKNTAQTLDATAKVAGDNGFSLMLVDTDEQLVFGVRNNGQLVTNDAKPLSIKRPYYLCSSAYLQNNLQQVSAPVPLNHMPLDFDVPSSLLQLTVEQPIATKIDTIYYEDDGVVHPNILDFYSGINGHQYWLGITPYYLNNDDFENPFIYTSDDLQSFALNLDFEQPLADQPQVSPGDDGYNSDVFFAYDFHSAELVLGWRTTIRGINTGTYLSCRRTRDGKTWSAPERMFDVITGHSVLSPSIVYDFDAKKYLLFCVDGESTGVYGISRYESNSITGPWVNRTFSAFDKSIIDPWHLDVRYVGRQLVCIINDNNSTHQLYMGISHDKGRTWDVGAPMITGAKEQPYKATFTPIYDGNQMALRVIWTSNQTATDPKNRWALYSAQTNFITIDGV